MILRRRKPEPMGVRSSPQVRCPAHLAWVRGNRCHIEQHPSPLECSGPTEAAHVRTGTDGGLSVKPSDFWSLPMCSAHHARQHQVGERAFEAESRIDMKAVAQGYAAKSPHKSKWLTP